MRYLTPKRKAFGLGSAVVLAFGLTTLPTAWAQSEQAPSSPPAATTDGPEDRAATAAASDVNVNELAAQDLIDKAKAGNCSCHDGPQTASTSSVCWSCQMAWPASTSCSWHELGASTW